MGPKKFSQEWTAVGGCAPLVPFIPNSLDGSDLPARTKAFLETTGLPRRAGPYLVFYGGQPFRVSEQWNQDSANFRFWAIGSDGYGSPIAVEEPTGEVVLLDHDCGFKRVFMNSSVAKLGEFLLAYRSFVFSVIDRWGSNALLEGRYALQPLQKFATQLAVIDPPAMEEGCWWSAEVALREDAVKAAP